MDLEDLLLLSKTLDDSTTSPATSSSFSSPAVNSLNDVLGIFGYTMSPDDNNNQTSAMEFPEIETGAEFFINEYFDNVGDLSISREGAGRFQNEILAEFFSVSDVKMSQGSAILGGSILCGDSSVFAAQLEKKFKESDLANEVSYVIMMNEVVPDPRDGFEQFVLDSLKGSTPCVIVYPKQWKSATEVQKSSLPTAFWSSALSLASMVLSAFFAANCFDLFAENGVLEKTGSIPPELVPLAISPVLIQSLSATLEKFVARSREFDIKTTLLPSFSSLTLFTFGFRSTHLGLAKSRSDIFDVSAMGLGLSLALSLLCLYSGLVLTADASKEALATFPTLPLPLLQVNSVVNQFIASFFPDIFATNEIPQELSMLNTVHLHWLAIVGVVSFIGNILNIIPLDDSHGSKLSFAALGREKFGYLVIIMNIIRFFFFVPFLFRGDSVVNAISKSRLIFDYIIISQLCGNVSETQIARDSITGLDEGRKIVFGFFVALLVLSFIPTSVYDFLQSFQ